MAQHEMNLRDYWLIIRRRRTIIIVLTLLVALLAFWFSRQRVPLYESTASVRYEQSTSLTGLLVEVLAAVGGDNIETQRSVIKSYPVLEEALRRMGKLPERPPGQPLRESRAYLNALDSLGAKVRTTRVPATSVIEITATSQSSAESRDTADTIAESYRDHNRQIKNVRITEARKYIEKQVRDAEARVKRAEEQFWAFREANSIIAPGAESGVLLSLFTQLRGAIETARQQRTELEAAQARLARVDPASFAERVFVDSTNPALQRLQATQVDLLLEYNNLSLEVTDRHPRLQTLADRMGEVRLEMRREIGAQMAMLRNREEILARQMGAVLQKNKDVPNVELGLQRLQREAKTSEDMLTLLRTKHQEALIKESERVEEVTIVRPATDPVEPVSTAGVNTVIVGALLGLMLGLVLAFVQETIAGYTYAHSRTHDDGEEAAARPPGRMARLAGFFDRRKPAREPTLLDADPADEGYREDTSDAEARQLFDRHTRRKYSNILEGVGVVVLLAAGIFAIAAWHMGWFVRDARPRTQDRRPVITPPAPRSEATPPMTSRSSVTAPASAAPVPVAPAPVASTPVAPAVPRTVPMVAARETAPREAPPRESAAKEPPAVAQAPRFAVEFGPFLTAAAAEKTERELNHAGHQTVRFRQQTGAALYAVLIERVPGTSGAQAVVAALREGGFPDGDVVGNGDALRVRVGEPTLLRAAVQLAESLRARGHQVRVAAQPGEARTFVIRHGNFASREEAEARGAELGRLGLANHVVRAK